MQKKCAVLIWLTSLLLGCAASPTLTYEEIVLQSSNEPPTNVGEIKRSFLNTIDLVERVEKITPLEEQVLAILEDEPLKLGAIGTAILDQNYASLTGHMALAAFYDYLEEDSANFHSEWVENITKHISDSGDGSRRKPYPMVTAAEGRAYLLATNQKAIGSIYQSNADDEFLLMLAARPAHLSVSTENAPTDQRVKSVFFDLQTSYQVAKKRAESTNPSSQFKTSSLISSLAQKDNSAAQAFIGTYLTTEGQFKQAINWLSASTRNGNILGNLVLAKIWLSRAQRASNKEKRSEAVSSAIENYQQAIHLGSDEAMFLLGSFLLRKQLNSSSVEEGITLLRDSGQLGNTEALVYLAELYLNGNQIKRNHDFAEKYFLQASELNDPYAKLGYARFLSSETVNKPFNDKAYSWLMDLAAEDNPEAQIIIGNLYATGLYVKKSYRRSVSWLKKAVRSAPEDPRIINEVAWSLAVSNEKKLRRPRYATKIMDAMMKNNERARESPAYLDTWAVAHAAIGNFEKAVEIQEEALAKAISNNQDAVIEILKAHLDAFRSGEVVIEELP